MSLFFCFAIAAYDRVQYTGCTVSGAGFSYSSSARKSITAVLLAMAFCSKGSSAKEVNLSGSAGGSCIPAISERLEPGSEKNGNAPGMCQERCSCTNGAQDILFMMRYVGAAGFGRQPSIHSSFSMINGRAVLCPHETSYLPMR